jgi:hypothetical protein
MEAQYEIAFIFSAHDKV